MGIMNTIRKIKLPKYKDVISISSTVRDESKKIDINTIDVLYHTANFKTSIRTKGTIDRSTSLPIVYLTIPESLGVFLIDDAIEIDLDTGKPYFQVVENYPFGIILNSELSDKLKSDFYNDCSSNKIGKSNKKQFEETGIGYLIPILINKIPYNVVRISLGEELHNNVEIEYATITQKILTELGHVKLLQSTNENKNDGMVIIGLIFGLIGLFIGASIMAYILTK
jgi:hypothetical protein